MERKTSPQRSTPRVRHGRDVARPDRPGERILQADAGIAVSGATDHPRAAADVVLLTPAHSRPLLDLATVALDRLEAFVRGRLKGLR
ncbi:hypothetical protein ACFY4C_17220 [Actinomadura viridis]|uniref:hypothetical protein n=1 Tax=Actinomadura viridis TaxID=58110 RepID=UPI0036A8B01B